MNDEDREVNRMLGELQEGSRLRLAEFENDPWKTTRRERIIRVAYDFKTKHRAVLYLLSSDTSTDTRLLASARLASSSNTIL